MWTVKYVAGLGYKTMDYVYDDLGNVTKSIYQKGTAAETMVHYFEYEKNKRLVAAYTNTTDNASTKVLHAKYSYYLHGPLKRVALGDKLQGIDYVYGIDGKLKSINNANASKDPGVDGGNGFAADVFGMSIEYYPGDYNNKQAGIPNIQSGGSAASYSGLINGISWFSKKPNSTDIAPVMNSYSYDAIGQLTENRWGAPNFTGSSFVSGGEINRERGLSYDGHGNIKTLIRTNGVGGELGNYTYNYQANSNKITSVTGYATYTYDAVGQLASQIKGSAGMYLDYDVSGKVTKIYSDAVKQTIILSFVYDEDGNRVMKKDHRTGAVTWYSYDGSGTLAAVFEQQGAGAVQLKEQPVYGSDRLGTFYRLGSNYQYTVTDHVGNTRVVINRNKTASGAADIVYYADYYPFGMEVRSGGIENRYGYQGLYAEKDKETGWNNFELRNYDAAIGRWLTTDPKAQYHSPYVGMGNNPVNRIDKDGGLDTDYVDSNGNLIYRSQDKSNDRIVVPDNMITAFNESIGWTTNASLAGSGWNNAWKAKILGENNFDILTSLGYTNQAKRQAQIDYFQNPTLLNSTKLSFAGVLATYTNPISLMQYASMGGAALIASARGLTNAEARIWYDSRVKSLSSSGPFTKEVAMSLNAQRNALKVQARALMADREAAANLDLTRPIQPFQYYVDKYTKEGYTGEALWQRIIQGTSTPNAGVNAKFGIK